MPTYFFFTLVRKRPLKVRDWEFPLPSSGLFVSQISVSFLDWTLKELRPLAEALDRWQDLSPLVEMAAGAPNTSERMRQRVRQELGDCGEIPLELLRAMAEEREAQVQRDVEKIAATYAEIGKEAPKLGEFLQHARDDVHLDQQVPVRFRPRPESMVEVSYADKTSEIVALAKQLIRIPSVTASPEERLGEVRRAATFIFDYLRDQGVGVQRQLSYEFPDDVILAQLAVNTDDIVPPG